MKQVSHDVQMYHMISKYITWCPNMDDKKM